MRNGNKCLIALFLSVIFLLSGCSVLHPPPTVPMAPLSWQQQQAQLQRILAWQMNARISVRAPNHNFLATLLWQQQPQQYQITVFGPLNFGSVKIVGTANQVTLWKTANQPINAANPEELMQTALGWQLPISNLYYWIRNLPAPGLSAKKQFDAAGHLIELQQQGWTIQYQGFQKVHQFDLPMRLDLANQSLHIRLVISQWQLPN